MVREFNDEEGMCPWCGQRYPTERNFVSRISRSISERDPLITGLADELISLAEGLKSGLSVSGSPIAAVFRALIDICLLGPKIVDRLLPYKQDSELGFEIIDSNRTPGLKFIKPETKAFRSTIESSKTLKVDKIGSSIRDPSLYFRVKNPNFRKFARTSGQFKSTPNALNASGTDETARIDFNPKFEPLWFEPDFQGKSVTIKIPSERTLIRSAPEVLAAFFRSMAERLLQISKNGFLVPDQFLDDRIQESTQKPKQSSKNYWFWKRDRARHSSKD